MDRYRTLLEVNNAVINCLGREELLEALTRVLKRVLPCDKAGLAFYDQTLEGRRADARLALFEEGLRSHAMAPLVVRGESVGVLGVGCIEPGKYGDEDRKFIEEVASQVALAVVNLRAYEQIHSLRTQLEAENSYYQAEIRSAHDFSEIVGQSPALLEALRSAEQVAPTDASVLVLGETGTGKELIAHTIHDRSPRKDRPLVKVQCGAISAGLVESELFGHVKGAFTGALGSREGRFKLADGGTLFLDEVAELSPEMQLKLLRVLQEGEFESIGSSKTLRVNVRIIAATNRDLAHEVQAGAFQCDLFQRLNVLPIRVPSLRERVSDIRPLASFFLQKCAARIGKKVHGLSEESLEKLKNYPWPGNVRELKNVIERAVVLSNGPLVTVMDDLRPRVSVAQHASPVEGSERSSNDVSARAESLSESLREIERRHIAATLLRCGWVIEGNRGAAKALGLHPNTLRHRLRKLDLRRPSKAETDAGRSPASSTTFRVS